MIDLHNKKYKNIKYKFVLILVAILNILKYTVFLPILILYSVGQIIIINFLYNDLGYDWEIWEPIKIEKFLDRKL